MQTNNHNNHEIKHENLRLTEEKLKEILTLLNCKPIRLIKKGEIIWKTLLKHLDFTDDELIKIILKYPVILKSPIIINGNKAVIGRPPELILDII